MNTVMKNISLALAVGLVACMLIPTSYAQNMILRNLYSAQDSTGAFLGIQMTDVTEKNLSEYKLKSVQGVIISSVVEGSPAEAAGIKKDDVLLEFDGIKVRSTIQLSRLVRETPVGREVEIVISRTGERKNLMAQLEEQDEKMAGSGSNIMPEWFPDGRGLLYRFPEVPERRMDTPERGRPMLGVTIQPLSEQMAEHLGVPKGKGVLVDSVQDASPSAGKLKAGDVIINAEGKDIVNRDDLVALVRQADGKSIDFKVIRDKKEISVTIDLESRGGRGFRL